MVIAQFQLSRTCKATIETQGGISVLHKEEVDALRKYLEVYEQTVGEGEGL